MNITNKFTLTCDKTMSDFERSLTRAVQDKPVLMSQVRPLLAKEGFDWVGALSEGVGQTQLLDVRYDNRYPIPVDFLVLKVRKDDVEYLSKCPNFDLGEKIENDNDKHPHERARASAIVRVWRSLLFLFTFGRSAKNRHIHSGAWKRLLRSLEKNKQTLTPCIAYRDGRETFTASDFLEGDKDAMIVRRNGTYITVKRREVKTLKLVPKSEKVIPQRGSKWIGQPFLSPRPAFQRSGIGRIETRNSAGIETWNSGKKCAFVIDEKTSTKFWFSANMVFDERLLRSLNSGKYGQTVRYSVVRENVAPGQLPVVQILEMVKDYVPDTHYKEGHDAMISGNLDLAVSCLNDIVNNRDAPNRLSAIKDLAEVYNRQGLPLKSLELIERERKVFPFAQTSFDMMEISYLERLSRWQEALSKVKALLENSDMPENRRVHFERKRHRIERLIATGGESGENDRKGDELMAQQIKDFGIVPTTAEDLMNMYVDGMGFNNNEFQTVRIIVLKLNDYLSVRTWKEKESIVQFVVSQMEGIIALPRTVCEAIGEALQKDMQTSIRNERGINLDGEITISKESGSAILALNLSLMSQSSIPLKDIRIILDEDHESEPVLYDKLSFDDGKVEVEVPFRLLKGEVETGQIAICVRVSYDFDINEEIVEALDNELIHRVVEKKLNFDSSTRTPKRIYPNPFEDYCNHIAKGGFFVGREELLNSICDVVAATASATGQSYVLFGQARSGKSSVRVNLANKLSSLGGGRIFYSEISVHAWTEDMVNRQPLEFLVYDLLVSVRKKLKAVGAWTDEARAEYAEIPSDYYAKKIEFLGDKLRDAGFLWVVAIDEFTDLYDILVTGADGASVNDRILDFLRVLKGVLESKRPAFNLLLIGQDSMPQFKKKFWNKFSISKERRVSYLEGSPTKQLLQEPLKGKIDISAEALSRYYYYVGGYPLYAMYFCARVVDYVNDHPRLAIVDVNDIDDIAYSFCRGDKKLRPDEFDPFVQLELPEVDGKELVSVYYALATGNVHRTDFSFVESAETRSHTHLLLKLLKDRCVVIEDSAGDLRLRMGLFEKYLIENPGLTIDDIRSAKGWYHD